MSEVSVRVSLPFLTLTSDTGHLLTFAAMLTRLVRMTFRPEETDAFLELWQINRRAIGTFPGCQQVQLLQDATNPAVFYTLSYWNGPDDLEAYRHSPLFARVWKATRALFAERAQTFSMMPPPPDPGKIA